MARRSSDVEVGLMVAVLGAAAPGADAQPVTRIDITNTPSYDAKGSGLNHVMIVTLPANSIVTRVGWVTKQSAYTPSWLSEMAIQLSDTPSTQSFSIRPAAGDNFSGTGAYTSGGLIPLSIFGIPNLPLANGLLRLEFYETFDDFPGAPDGEWSDHISSLDHEVLQSILTIEYIPAPSTAVVLGLAGLAAARRRRG